MPLGLSLLAIAGNAQPSAGDIELSNRGKRPAVYDWVQSVSTAAQDDLALVVLLRSTGQGR